jgi:hypothetical protein
MQWEGEKAATSLQSFIQSRGLKAMLKPLPLTLPLMT